MTKRTPILRPLALALVLAAGFATVYGFAVGWSFSIWEQMNRGIVVSESLYVRSDGEPLVAKNVYSHGNSVLTWRTLDGADAGGPDGGALRAASLPFTRSAGPARTWPDWTFPLEAVNRIAVFHEPQSSQAVWYFLHNGGRDGRGYFAGFDEGARRRVGYIGRQGFRTDEPPPEECFPVDGLKWHDGAALWPEGPPSAMPRYSGYANQVARSDFPAREWKVNMLTGNQLLQVDLRRRTVTTLIDSADLVSLGALMPIWTKSTPNRPKAATAKPEDYQLLAVRTPDRVLLLDLEGKQKAAFTLPAEIREARLNVYDLGNETLMNLPWPYGRDRNAADELLWFDAAGKIVRRATCHLASVSPPDERAGALMAVAVLPASVTAAVAAGIALPLTHLDVGDAANYPSALRRSLVETWPAILLAAALGAALAWLCYRRQRRFAQKWTAVWVTFVFILGVPGYVAYRFQRRWPVLEKCPACGRTIPRDRDSCAACTAEFPRPELKGIEVFA